MENRLAENAFLRILIKRPTRVFILSTALALLAGCSHTKKVMVPPRVSLSEYRMIGVIEFTTNGKDDLKGYVTQNFIQHVQSAQPGSRILELGSKETLLLSIKRKDLDLEAIKAIGKTWNVDAVVTGHMEISEIKPSVKMSTGLNALHARAHIEGRLLSRLWETDSGATLWTKTSFGKTPVAGVKLMGNGHFKVGVSDPKEKYEQLVPKIVFINTSDFRPQYEYVRVK